MTSCLLHLVDELRRLDRFPPTSYRIPGLWVGQSQPVTLASVTRFYLDLIDELLASPQDLRSTRRPLPVIYNAMVRHAASYDHGPEATSVGWTTTGTFVKMIAMLPYLRSLSVETIMLLPVNPIGMAGRKGALGSPYAVRNPFAVDPNLAEPLIRMTPEEQARAFVEAAHRWGMRVVTEVVLRTASLDSVLVEDHPEWFYWIRVQESGTEPFCAPAFSDVQIASIRQMIDQGSRENLPEPSAEFRRQFTEPPSSLQIRPSGWCGQTVEHDAVRLPGAFADWPPDDPQPAWDDVTYLKLHHHPRLNYMAYNTIRMFDAELERPGMENIGVWNMIASVIPTQMRMLGVDGAMIDMGHALPARLRRLVIDEARLLRPDALLIEENFNLDEHSHRDGIDAVTGYLPFDAHTAEGLRGFVRRLAKQGAPVRYLASGESHNTPRWATRVDPELVPGAWMFLSLLPKGLPLIVAGMEHAETRPINTGLGFSPDEIEAISPESLALFNDVPLPWDGAVESVDRFMHLLDRVSDLHVVGMFCEADDVTEISGNDPDVVGFHRHAGSSRCGLLVVLNLTEVKRQCVVDLGDLRISAVAVSDHWSLEQGRLECQIDAKSLLLVPTYLHAS